ncbi:GNAT family N-acetyltransferase [Sporosarcina thermotolerans]|uniref:GNAT family N-acetyltransferase n=1 Tax=Sporosarcina thermotolerans TaxID=633404 RepID=A0AAW9A926_9BACL|nr:GNAT family N-acetyltransferase [Sporosarcina thermotolerans]MDW0117697.1 GNAT family N-acetyltransferase [Sporosarcina thermotolerans]
MRLERPSMKWKSEHIAYMKDWDEEKINPSSFRLIEDLSYEDYLIELKEKEAGQDNRVPNSNYFLVDGNDRIIGTVTIRHSLNDYLRKVDGHIGAGIRPSERRKGYATFLLSEALKITDQLGINSVLVTCNEDNIGSAAVIIKNGGVEDESFTEPHGNVVRRFWIER